MKKQAARGTERGTRWQEKGQHMGKIGYCEMDEELGGMEQDRKTGEQGRG